MTWRALAQRFHGIALRQGLYWKIGYRLLVLAFIVVFFASPKDDAAVVVFLIASGGYLGYKMDRFTDRYIPKPDINKLEEELWQP